MKTTIVKIGNSRGVRIPKPVFEQCEFEDEVEMEVRNHELIIRCSHLSREGWDAAFQAMAKHKDDSLLDRVAESRVKWDEEEWEWK